MHYKIFWTPAAKESYYQILEYLNLNWSQKEINKFIIRTEEVLHLISLNPKVYPFVTTNIYRSVLTKHNSLFYKIDKNIITILACWDNRKDPKKLKT